MFNLKFGGTYVPNLLGETKSCNLSIANGDNLNIIGDSGSGKSSYINKLIGLPSIIKGDMFLDNKNFKYFNHSDWCQFRRNIFSLVKQDLGLFDHLTAKENIFIFNNLKDSIPKPTNEEIIFDLGLEIILSQKVSSLSMGEKQRVAICRSLVKPFSLLILDEPFSHLDKKNKQNTINIIDRILKQKNAAMIMTSHSSCKNFNYKHNIVL